MEFSSSPNRMAWIGNKFEVGSPRNGSHLHSQEVEFTVSTPRFLAKTAIDKMEKGRELQLTHHQEVWISSQLMFLSQGISDFQGIEGGMEFLPK